MAEILDWNISDNIGHLILNDPPTNRMSKNFFLKFNEIVSKVITHSKVKAIIIYGQGRHFSSGADLDELFKSVLPDSGFDLPETNKKPSNFLAENNKSFLILDKLDIPVIAAVNGVCLGSALELALYGHVRICTKNAIFGFPETSFNIIPGLGGTQKILNYLKFSKALEIVLKGDTFNAEEAFKYGIVDKIVNKNELFDFSLFLAKELSNIKNYDKNRVKEYLKDFCYN